MLSAITLIILVAFEAYDKSASMQTTVFSHRRQTMTIPENQNPELRLAWKTGARDAWETYRSPAPGAGVLTRGKGEPAAG